MSCKALFLDIHGVLYNSSNTGSHEILSGSIDAIRKLKEAKFPFMCVSNESQMSVDALQQKLMHIGFQLDKVDIFTPVMAISDVIKKDQLKPYCIMADSMRDCIPHYSSADCNCVVLTDAVNNFNYDSLNEAFSILMSRPQCRFLSAGKGKFYHDSKLGTMLDVGPFTHAIEFATSRTAEILGKPSPDFFKAALAKIGLPPNQVTMIGDDIVNDVSGAQKAGLRGILVRSGKYRPVDENHPTIKPDLVVDSLMDFVNQMVLQRG